MTIQIAAIVTAVVVLAIILIGLYVGKNSGEKGEGFIQKLYKLRSIYFIFLIGVIVVLLVLTMNNDAIPYPESKTGKPDVTVQVTGSMYNWDIVPSTIPVGKVIEFAVSSTDVTHGFGIYNSDGQIITQVQVMPGYTNKLRYTFKEPGEYKIICMELCGVAHQAMNSTIQVVSEVETPETGGTE
ncbi:MAG: hypothetical protein ABUK01_00150 [Leptospirales bacterium]